MRELNFSLDPASLLDVETAVKYLSDLVKPDSFDARHYVAGAKGVDTLYLLVSLCRSGTAYIARAIALLGMFGAEAAIEFHQSAAKKTNVELANSDVFGKANDKAVKAEAEFAAAQEVYETDV